MDKQPAASERDMRDREIALRLYMAKATYPEGIERAAFDKITDYVMHEIAAARKQALEEAAEVAMKHCDGSCDKPFPYSECAFHALARAIRNLPAPDREDTVD